MRVYGGHGGDRRLDPLSIHLATGLHRAISHYSVMDWAAIWKDIAGGLLIAGALGAWVPHLSWQAFFLEGNPILAKL